MDDDGVADSWMTRLWAFLFKKVKPELIFGRVFARFSSAENNSNTIAVYAFRLRLTEYNKSAYSRSFAATTSVKWKLF
ncbi:unnamed protein product [Cuscuta campestris]|uniref:Uncharacterized protein n=1 Tax=Cuscuta campestris TaxID=132261 RepID=A0A484MVR2_9ASTE|nr:unnamed protein product [Cuscuta campestris]